jgi:hypothetical protein
MLVVAAILLQPLPALAAGTLTVAAYGFGVMLKVSAFYALWRLAVVRLMQRASNAAFNPLLLRVLRDACDDVEYRQRHTFALQQIEYAGLSLSQALFGTGLLRNFVLHSFVKSAEESGTLHGDLRQYLARKRSENAGDLDHMLRKLALWLYAGAMLLTIGTYF